MTWSMSTKVLKMPKISFFSEGIFSKFKPWIARSMKFPTNMNHTRIKKIRKQFFTRLIILLFKNKLRSIFRSDRSRPGKRIRS